jgi:hypothetical protein
MHQRAESREQTPERRAERPHQTPEKRQERGLKTAETTRRMEGGYDHESAPFYIKVR